MRYIQCVMLAALLVASEQARWTCTDFSVTDKNNCTCSEREKGNEIKCPGANITFLIGAFSDVDITCNEVISSHLTLPLLNIESVNNLKLKDCLPSEVSVRDVMNRLGLGKTWSISISGKVDSLAKGQLANLTSVVTLEGLGLTDIDQDIFVDQNTTESEITVLYLNKNNISQLHDTTFKRLKKLLQLDISYNQLSSLPDDLFVYSKNLTGLNLSHNRLQNVSSKLISNLGEGLQLLNFSHNHLKHLDGEWKSLDNLNHLDLSHNHLSSLGDGEESVLKNLKNLWVLDLSNNSLTRIYPDWLRELRFVQLANNSIKAFNVDMLKNGTSAMSIDLFGNNITELDVHFSQPFVGSVAAYLAGNPLVCDCHLHPLAILKGDTQSCLLPFFDLDIANLTCGSPPSLKGRLVVDVPLEQFTCPTTVGCPKHASCYYQPEGGYTVVDYVGTPQPVYGTRPVPVSNRTRVVVSGANLADSGFTITPALWPNLEDIDLSNTNLSSFAVSGGIGGLKKLNISHNQLKRLSDDTVRQLQSLESLILHHNPWNCSSKNEEFLRLVNTTCKTPI